MYLSGGWGIGWVWHLFSPFFMAFTASEFHFLIIFLRRVLFSYGVSCRVLVVHLYTTVVGDGSDHARDYTRCVVIHFMAYIL